MKKLSFILLFCFSFWGSSSAQQGWYVLSSNMPTSSIDALAFPSRDTGFYSGGSINNTQPPFLKVTYDGGLNWNTIVPYSQYPQNPIFLNSKIGYYLDGSNIIKTTNSGISWSVVIADTLKTGFNAIDFVSPAVGFICGSTGGAGKVFKTDDSEKTWTESFSTGLGAAYEIKFKDTLTGYVLLYEFPPYASTELWRTTDGGNNWNEWKNLYPYVPSLFQYLKGQNIWIGRLSNNTITRWNEDGVFLEIDTLFQITDLKNPEQIKSIAFYGGDSIGYAVTNKGRVFKTINFGKHWFLQSTPNAFTYGNSIVAASSSVAYAAGNGVLIKTTDGGGPPVNSVRSISDNSKFILLANPISLSADFQFDALKEPTVFELFDALGRMLLRQQLSAGQASLHIDMQNMPSGMYFARLRGMMVRFVKY